jgi:glycine/D-amino acid oxidase-like deaminating enzyme
MFDGLENRISAIVAVGVLIVGGVFCPATAVVGSDECEVCVVGAGPAGIGAALSSAEVGAQIVLLERNDFVGGTTVAAEVRNIGLFHAWKRQIIDGPAFRLVTNAMVKAGRPFPDISRQDGDRNWQIGCFSVDPQVYAQTAQTMLGEAGVVVRLQSEVVGALADKNGWRIRYRRNGKIQELFARCVVDATGNATVAALAGAERVRSKDEDRQPGSYFFWIDTRNRRFDAVTLDRAQVEAVRCGDLLPTDLTIPASQYARNGGGWGVYIPLADDSTPAARDATRRRGEAAKARILAFLRRQPGLERTSVVRSAREVGVRETYRVVGEATVTQEDYLSGRLYPDSLVYSFWMIDRHDAGKGKADLVFHENGAVGAIQLGAMIPKGVSRMLVAGRAVSSDHGANSALRVQASCMGMGQVAGVAAALSAKKDVDVRSLELPALREALRSIGAIVPTPSPSR